MKEYLEALEKMAKAYRWAAAHWDNVAELAGKAEELAGECVEHLEEAAGAIDIIGDWDYN